MEGRNDHPVPRFATSIDRSNPSCYPSRGSFDLRRPIMSSTHVIDLTDSDDHPLISNSHSSANLTHPSHYQQHEVIDLEASGSGSHRTFHRENSHRSFGAGFRSGTQSQQYNGGPSLSEEVEFLFERERPPVNSNRNSWRPHFPGHGHLTYGLPFPSAAIHPIYRHNSTTSHPYGHGFADDRSRFQISNAPASSASRLFGAVSYTQGVFRHLIPHLGTTRLPGEMNYNQVPFDVNDVPLPNPPSAASSVPVIEDLPPTPEGFTRTPDDKLSLICPNCERILAEGDSEAQASIFVAKACGHVYCGECAQNRLQPKRKRKAEESKVNFLSVCVVENCGKNLRPKTNMVQIFL